MAKFHPIHDVINVCPIVLAPSNQPAFQIRAKSPKMKACQIQDYNLSNVSNSVRLNPGNAATIDQDWSSFIHKPKRAADGGL